MSAILSSIWLKIGFFCDTAKNVTLDFPHITQPYCFSHKTWLYL